YRFGSHCQNGRLTRGAASKKVIMLRSRALGLSRLITAALAVLLAGCSPAARVIPLSVIPGQASPPAHQIADYPEAFQAIGSVMSRELGLPLPQVSLYLYP